MKTFVFGIAAAAVIGLGSMVAPASATTITPEKIAATQITDFSSQHRGHAHRGHRFHRGPVCTVRTVVKRGPYGRRIVNKVRVCR